MELDWLLRSKYNDIEEELNQARAKFEEEVNELRRQLPFGRFDRVVVMFEYEEAIGQIDYPDSVYNLTNFIVRLDNDYRTINVKIDDIIRVVE
jgi:hypothetical protein